MRKLAKSLIVLIALGFLLKNEASASDITSYNILQTSSPATIEKVEVLHPSFKIRHIIIQPWGGLEQPIISFTVVNKSAVTISKMYLSGVLQARGRAVPFAAQDINLSIPGGLEPGELKHFNLDATLYGDWSRVTKHEIGYVNFMLTLKAVDDAAGARIVK